MRRSAIAIVEVSNPPRSNALPGEAGFGALPSHLEGTNRLGDGEIVKFTPKQPVPKDGEVGWFGNLFSWGSFREFWHDWTSPPIGEVTNVRDLGNPGELVDRARQCPTQVY